MFFASTICHTMTCHSEKVSHNCIVCDYIGIATIFFGSYASLLVCCTTRFNISIYTLFCIAAQRCVLKLTSNFLQYFCFYEEKYSYLRAIYLSISFALCGYTGYSSTDPSFLLVSKSFALGAVFWHFSNIDRAKYKLKLFHSLFLMLSLHRGFAELFCFA